MTNSRICVSICAARVSDLVSATKRAARETHESDLIELRLDCLSEEEFARMMRDSGAKLRRLIAGASRPIILTLRHDAQGGRRKASDEERAAFWKRCSSFLDEGKRPTQNFADIELDLLEGSFNDNLSSSESSFDLSRVICSHHDFAGVPNNLVEIYGRARRTNARVIKIAARVSDAIECLPLLRLLDRARADRQDLIAVAMGEAGSWMRALAPARGSFLTYAALDEAHPTAPGQITANELLSLYRIRQLDAQTEIMGVIGSPVAHSLSPQIHNRAFAARNLNAVYLPFLVRDLAAFLRRMAHPRTREIEWRLRGLSVTAPHKETIIPRLDFVDEAAREIGAVNTVRVEGDKLCGYNTDANAALVPLRNLIELRGAHVAVLGAGGAARSVLWRLRGEGAHATVFARNLERAGVIARNLDARIAELKDARFNRFDLIINTTPLGTRGQSETETPATAEQLRGARLVYDLVYNPAETKLLREAREAGCATVERGGLAMLIAQAATQFKLWTGEDAPLDTMRHAAEEKMLDVRC